MIIRRQLDEVNRYEYTLSQSFRVRPIHGLNFTQRDRKFQPTIEIATAETCAYPSAKNNTLMIYSIRRVAFVLIFLARYAAAQAVQPERFERDFNVLFRGGEYMNLYAMGTLDQKSRDHVNSNTEATVSKFDLKAPGRAKDAYTRALRFLAKNDLKGAVENLQKATSLYPNYVAAHNALGCAYFQLNEYEQARKEFAQATQRDDHLSSSYLNLGRAQLALGENSAAQASMEKASSIAPLDQHLLLALAYAQYVNHDYAETIKTAKRAHTQSHPETAIVHYYAAASWQALKDLHQARDELQTFLAEDPKSSLAAAAQRAVDQIRTADERPAPSVATNVPTRESMSGEPSRHEQDALQDLREKQQIADAEAEGSSCPSCDALSQPGSGGPLTGNVPAAASGIRESKPGPWSLRSTVNEVAVFFSATDNGKSVTDLAPGDVKILDDRKPPAAVLGFHSESDLPLRLGLLIDTSASVQERFSFEQNAAINFMNQVATGKDDLAFVAGFSNSVVLAKDFTPDLNELARGIHQLVPVGGTAIWDAIGYAAEKLAERQEARPVARILVVISDGDDNASNSTLKQAIERAERNEVIVYTVSTRYADAESTRSDPTGNRAMKVLAQLTGGVAFFPGSASHLNRSLAELQQVIRSRYLISYRPALFNPDGHYRPIAIIAEKSGHKLKVNARKGYYSIIQSADSSSN
jgi:VWFA-related protein